MDIKTSLIIENKGAGKINLIFSGSFVRVYNQSLYILTQVLGKPLKVVSRYIKSADNQLVIYGGFPSHRVELEHPQAKKMPWGYQISGDFCSGELSTVEYQDWLLHHEAMAQATANAVTAAVPYCTQGGQSGTAKNANDSLNKSIDYNLLLTEQQMQYLTNWQKGLYPIEVDLGFIESLKQLKIND